MVARRLWLWLVWVINRKIYQKSCEYLPLLPTVLNVFGKEIFIIVLNIKYSDLGLVSVPEKSFTKYARLCFKRQQKIISSRFFLINQDLLCPRLEISQRHRSPFLTCFATVSRFQYWICCWKQRAIRFSIGGSVQFCLKFRPGAHRATHETF